MLIEPFCIVQATLSRLDAFFVAVQVFENLLDLCLTSFDILHEMESVISFLFGLSRLATCQLSFLEVEELKRNSLTAIPDISDVEGMTMQPYRKAYIFFGLGGLLYWRYIEPTLLRDIHRKACRGCLKLFLLLKMNSSWFRG